MATFTLHPQLAADTLPLLDLPLCKVLLMNDRQYPWLILVPQVRDAREFIDLTPREQQQLWAEMTGVQAVLKEATRAQKLNVAALGNMVPQLHIHIIARFEGDAAWPKPVWGQHPAKAYSPIEAGEFITRLRPLLDRMVR
ncbi:MAG TPA: HIT family protein [Alphaproteobacteria bacterium]|nr:HIT family protein [Alphaproteobacteria bacterium]